MAAVITRGALMGGCMDRDYIWARSLSGQLAELPQRFVRLTTTAGMMALPLHTVAHWHHWCWQEHTCCTAHWHRAIDALLARASGMLVTPSSVTHTGPLSLAHQPEAARASVALGPRPLAAEHRYWPSSCVTQT